MVTMSSVWDRTTEFLSDNLGAVTPLALGAIFVPISIQGSLAGVANAAQGAIAVQAISLLLSLVSYWAKLAIIALAIDPAVNRAAATRIATARLPVAILLGLIVFALLVVVILPVIVALAAAGFDFQGALSHKTMTLPPAVSGFAALYLLVAGVFLFWLAARLVLLGPVIVNERRGIGAFARSFALTRGLTWRIIGVILLFAIVVSVSTLAAKLVFGSIFALMFGRDGGVSLATVLTSILVAGVATSFTVLATAFTAKLYLAARDYRETAFQPAA